MNELLVFLVVTCVAMATAETYTDRYDNINIDEILANRKLLVAYINCTLDKGRCSPEGKELKLHLTDAMITGCTKCTNKQKYYSRKVVKHLKAKEQEYWEQLKAKYDPKDQYKDIYEAFLSAED